MKQFNTLLIEEQNDNALIITLNRPEKANAISPEMMDELLEIISDLRYNSDIKYVVFKGAGKHFSGGADLSKLVELYDSGNLTPSAARLNQSKGHEIMNKLEELEQVTIVAIDGPCIGGGLALALACDFRIMTEKSTISIPEVERGIFFTWGSTPRMINIVGVAKAKELIMLCDTINSEEALGMNLVTKVVPNNALMDEVDRIISKLDSSPFLPIRMTKKIANAASIGVMKNVMIYDTELFEQSILSGEPIEEMKKFVNRKLT
ncbi:hypothetical protein BTR23_23985 [Alkalihalophilus pseudofirmus]|nr:hypothetical protein BTR23_23985 [Alkalihalophilus pseudofirmus]